MITSPPATEVQNWPIDKLVFYVRNPRKNDSAVDRMCGSIREFGFKIPVLARSNGEVVDGHLRLKAARKLGITEVPVILCDEWSEAQVKAFRLIVNRSVTWAAWDEELLAIELQELNAADFDLSLTGFDQREIDGLLALPEEEEANSAPPLPANPVSRLGDLWLCGKHRVLCGSATSAEDVARPDTRMPHAFNHIDGICRVCRVYSGRDSQCRRKSDTSEPLTAPDWTKGWNEATPPDLQSFPRLTVRPYGQPSSSKQAGSRSRLLGGNT
jgi:hypothetical protein